MHTSKVLDPIMFQYRHQFQLNLSLSLIFCLPKVRHLRLRKQNGCRYTSRCDNNIKFRLSAVIHSFFFIWKWNADLRTDAVLLYIKGSDRVLGITKTKEGNVCSWYKLLTQNDLWKGK